MTMARRGRGGLLCVLLSASLAWPASCGALGSDRSKPIMIEADRAKLDEHSGVSVYEGNVVLSQGTLLMHGERMTLTVQDRQINRILVEGKPARVSQRPDGADADQQAEAGRIDYDTHAQRLLLQDNAAIRQSGREEFRSDRIEINLRDNTLQAGGNSTQDRVHITLQPARPATETAPPTAPQ